MAVTFMGQIVHGDESMVAGLPPAPAPFLISFLLCQMVLLSILGSVRRGSVGPPARGSHAALFPLGLGGAFCSRSRFQLPFEEEEKKGKERREWSGELHLQPAHLPPPSCLPLSSCQLTLTSDDISSNHRLHTNSRLRGRCNALGLGVGRAKFCPESRFKRFFLPERNPVTFLCKWECKKWPLCHSLSLSFSPVRFTRGMTSI